MENLQWSSQLSVGVHRMDEEHVELLALFNDLCAALEDQCPRELCEPLMRKFLAATSRHFASEEALLASAGYPGLPNHANHHRDLNTLMKEYLARFDRGDLGGTANLLRFLRHWLVRHTEIEDKAYGNWLTARAIS